MRHGCRVREGALSYCNAFIKSLSGTPGAITWGSVSPISRVGNKRSFSTHLEPMLAYEPWKLAMARNDTIRSRRCSSVTARYDNDLSREKTTENTTRHPGAAGPGLVAVQAPTPLLSNSTIGHKTPAPSLAPLWPHLFSYTPYTTHSAPPVARVRERRLHEKPMIVEAPVGGAPRCRVGGQPESRGYQRHDGTP